MTDNIKSAIISAVITATGTIIAAYVGNIYIKGNYGKKAVEILSNNFENVDNNMKYSEIVDQISNEMTELEEENYSLNDKLNEITSEKEKLKTELDRKNKAISNETTTNEEKIDNPVVEQTKTTGNFIELCKPYEILDKVNYVECKSGKSFEMAGEKRTNGFTNLCYNTYVLFNLNGKYNELNFDIGHVDGEQMIDVIIDDVDCKKKSKT